MIGETTRKVTNNSNTATNKNKTNAANSSSKKEPTNVSAAAAEELNKRTTRSTQRDNAQVLVTNNTPAKEKQDKKEISSQMKKIRIDEDEEVVEKLLDKQAIASVQITKDQKKTVYQAISKLSNEKKANSITKDQLWKYVQANDIAIANKAVLDRAIIELHDDEKIFFDATKNEIYLY